LKIRFLALLVGASFVSACFDVAPPPYVRPSAPAPLAPPTVPVGTEPWAGLDCTWVDQDLSWEEVLESFEGTYAAEAGITSVMAESKPGAGQGGRYGTVEIRRTPGVTIHAILNPTSPLDRLAFEIKGWPQGNDAASPWLSMTFGDLENFEGWDRFEAEGFPSIDTLLTGTGCELRDLYALYAGPTTVVTNDGTTRHELWLIKTGPARFDGLWRWSGEGSDFIGGNRVTLTRMN
jgi:hypothetical protein